jgi:hypothetical protein
MKIAVMTSWNDETGAAVHAKSAGEGMAGYGT